MLGATTEDHMVAEYLRGELASQRFGPAIRAALRIAREPEAVVGRPDVRSARENAYRRRLLTDLRGFETRTEVFTGFPRDVGWHEAIVERRELATVRYIDYSYWNALSGGSRLAADAAANIERGIEVFGVSNSGFLAAAAALRNGAQFPPLLLVGTGAGYLVVLEGHLRLTALALAPAHGPTRLRVLAGLSPGMAAWACY